MKPSATAAAILIGALMLAVATVGARLIAPYEITEGSPNEWGWPTVWRVNSVTGAVDLCGFRQVDGRATTIECVDRVHRLSDNLPASPPPKAQEPSLTAEQMLGPPPKQ